MNKQTKITDYFYSERTAAAEERSNKLEKLRTECLRIREECNSVYNFPATKFTHHMGTLTEYVLALGDKINSMK